ncbi:nucleotidyltransferase [Mycobacterium hodleri]|uniref:Nucleotidyltransferase n=1 Tax=Mycolicibacterium hodleri TaxID=49897 RepID=A0A544W098_9MYCO|nr:nucleotidyltransferase [Mycolicibacterium hodleri]TQR85668.1 nucleotidyltransferase [Mycolicibacterium hodleri]
MAAQISQFLIDRYSAGPSSARTTTVKSLQESVRAALAADEGTNFDTFLQGSYRNGTAIADINDVDIVALYDPWQAPASRDNWNWLFNRIATILRASPLVSGAVTLGDKCVKLDGTLHVDIVPAISPRPYSSTDPITVYSRNNWEERPNYPRTHYQRGVAKQAFTDDTYKATVRLFKRWVRQYPSLNAPSFYIECAVHSVNSTAFSPYLPLSFAGTAVKIADYSRHSVIMSVAGDKDILVPAEWDPDDFEDFQRRLKADTKYVLDAITSDSQTAADRLWKLAFGD